MTLPAGLDLETLVQLEWHETRVHSLPGREIRDLGDALILFDRLDREPFWNRAAAVRWPTDPAAFDRRLAEAITLFAVLDRIPHLWPRPALNEPRDLVARLVANGWRDEGGGCVMVLDDADIAAAAARERRAPGVTLERLPVEGVDARRAASDMGIVLAEAFDVDPGRRAAMEDEALVLWGRSEMQGYLVRVDGEPAAAAKRTTFDGMSYLSSVGTRPAFRGRGLARIVTAAATADAVEAGSRWTYLGVYASNEPAVRLYERLGYAMVGDPAPDLVLR